MEKNDFSYAKRKVIGIPIMFLIFGILLICHTSAAGLKWGIVYTYDPLNDTTINESLWQNTSDIFTDANNYMYVREIAPNYIEAKSVTRDASMRDSYAYTIALPNYNAFDNINFSAYLFINTSFGPSGSYGVSLNAFNNIIKSQTQPNTFNDLTQYVFIRSGSQFLIYGNGVFLTTITPSNNEIRIRAYAGFIDGIGTQTTMAQIYPITYILGNNSMNVNLDSPANEFFHYSPPSLPTMNITFNVSTSTVINNLKNVTFYIDGIPRYSIDITGISNFSTYSANFTLGDHIWKVYACDDADNCKFSENRIFHESNFITLNTSYSPTTYETETQRFNTTVLYDTTTYPNAYAYLTYNGITYPVQATKTISGPNVIFNSTIDIPESTGIKPFYFTVYFDPNNPSNAESTTINNQTVNPINFSICGGPGGSTAYINFVYLNELDATSLNLSVQSSSFNYWVGSGTTTKTYFYTSGGVTSPNVTFCFSPDTYVLFNSPTYQYGVTGFYPFRTFQTIVPSFLTLTNLSFNQSLYSLSSVDSGSITIQVIDPSSGSVIPGARVTISRSINGVPTIIFDGFTDSAGTINTFLSTTTSYTITGSKSGCGTNTQTVIPVGSYNLQLNCGTNATQYVSQIQGVTYQRSPQDGVNQPGPITYMYSVSSSTFPIQAAKFIIKDDQGNIIASNETNVSSGRPWCTNSTCLLTIFYNTGSGDNLKGNYYVKLGNATNSSYILLEGDARWRFIIINTNNTNSGITNFANQFNEFFYQWEADGRCNAYSSPATCAASGFCKWVNNTGYSTSVQLCVLKDDYNKAEFSRVILIFFGMVVVLFIIGRTTGYEMTNPGSFVMFMAGAIIIMSILGFFRFNGATPDPTGFLDQYIYAMICLCFSIGYNISIIRRYST